MRHRLILTAAVLPLLSPLGVTQSPESKSLPPDRAKGGETFDKEQIREWLTVLTSKEFAGRGTGQHGFKLAAHFVKNHFEQLGLKPGAPGGKWFQPVPWSMTGPDKEEWKFAASKDGRVVHELALESMHGNLGRSVSAEGKAMVALVDDLDDPPLEEVELEGTILFLVITEDTTPRVRARGIRNLQTAAGRTGAGAVILVDSTTYKATTQLAGAVTQGTGRAARGRFLRPNSFVIDEGDFAKLIQSLGQNPGKIRSSEGVVALGGATVEVNIQTKTMQAPAYNVIGVLPGSDPKLADEYVVIGCHLDHLGLRRGTIYPGADDDGSGSVGLMAIAQAFAKNGKAPRRSVMFTAFCGEENGLIGSAYFAKNPPVELSQIVGELQIDMIGRDEQGQRGNEDPNKNKNSVHLIGTEKLSNDLHELCLRLNDERADFDLEWDEEGVFYRSDHWNFAKYGVPIAFFFTGFHRDYHQPTDTVEKINFDKLTRIAKYVYDIGFELGQADERPLIEPKKWRSLQRKGSREPAAPLRGQTKK